MGWLSNLLGIGPKVVRARPDGAMPWSQTVVNINRQKRKRNRRMLLLVVFMITAGMCLACSLYAWTVTQGKKAVSVSSRPTQTLPPTPRPTPTSLVIPTPTPRKHYGPTQTPQPRPMIEIQSWSDLVEGQPGTTIHLTVNATQDGHVTIWWDNRDVLAKTDTTNFNASLDVTIPAGATPGQHVVIVEVLSLDGYSVDRVISPFMVIE